eukprot:1810452-Rhodomonas_salina.2
MTVAAKGMTRMPGVTRKDAARRMATQQARAGTASGGTCLTCRTHAWALLPSSFTTMSASRQPTFRCRCWTASSVLSRWFRC